MRQACLLILFTFILITSTQAAIRFEDAVTPELAVSGRALAMGNAYIAKSDDASAVLYNPAGLGTVRNSHLHLSNFYFEINKGWMNIATNGKADDAASNFASSLDTDGVRKLMLTNRGQLSQSRFSFMPNFTTRFFSAGYLVSNQNRATLDSAPGALFEFAERLDHGPFGSFAIAFLGGIVKFGATVIFVNRTEKIGEIDPNTTVKSHTELEKKGSALLTTLGGKLTFPVPMLPTLAFVTHNALDKDFSTGSTNGSPTKVKRTVNVGLSLTPHLGQTTRLHLEINRKDFAGQYEEVSGQRKTTFGMEFDFFRVMFVRFGYGDGYGSAGLGIKTQRLEFDFTTYAVDTTTSSFRGEEDRRFALSISSGF
jgi:hypothetical protein